MNCFAEWPFIKIALYYFFTYILFTLSVTFIFYFLFYRKFKDELEKYKIQKDFKGNQQGREVKNSVFAIIVQALSGVVVIFLFRYHCTLIYMDSRGILFSLMSFIGVVLLNDCYFYWTHRWLHSKLLIKYHAVHHKSTNPTPLSAFSCHFIEAIINAFVFPLMVVIVPLSWPIIIFFLVFMILTTILGHSGYEFLPSKFYKSPVGQYFYSSSHHNIHHSSFQGNFAFYFTFWDKISKTEKV